VAAEQDAARDRVLAARAALDQELDELRGSARAAVDIPAQVRKSPAKAAAVAGGLAFFVLRGPQRLWGAFRERVLGKPARMPSRMLPKEIEKTLGKLGDDGDKVRGTLERDFAAYVKDKQKERRGLIPIVLLGLARPVIARAARRAGEFLVQPSSESEPTNLDVLRARFGARAEETRAKAEMRVEEAKASAERAAEAAKERVDRAAETAKEKVDRARGATNEDPPTGV